MKKLMVLDGNSIVNRAFYGVSQNLTTRAGQPTNAIFGFLNILIKLLDEGKPDALCVTFDRKAPTFRHLAYEGYKATRKGMPDELASQLPLLKDVLAAMNIPMYELDGWEADDLIGTISVKDTAAGWETVIVTGDKDSLQLVTDTTTVKLVSTRMGRTTTRDMTPEAFREEYGFDPIHIIDLKALMGDSSDNIPGVKGVGEKTAMALVQRYGSIDDLYAALPEVEMAPGTPAKPGVIKKLTEGEDQARMSYDLATIHTDAPIDFAPENNLRKEPNGPALYQLFLDLEFAKLIDKFHLTAPQGEGAVQEEAAAQVNTASEAVETRERLEELGLNQIYQEVDLPLCPVLAEMEEIGVLVDRGALVEFGEMLSDGIDKVQATIYELAGEEFNINSTQQLGRILFDQLGLPPVKKTKTGYSTNAEVLDKLRGKHPIIEQILDYRQLTKLKSTYVDGLGKVIADDGRIHTCFQNTVTATGRLSSAEPNLQNIPIRTPLGAELRKMFVAGPGMALVDADYSQIELRLLAHMAGDEKMIEAFRSGRDFHTVTAAQVFGVEPDQVTHEMRRSAKAVNFGIVYGISAFSLSQDIGVTVAEAKAYMDRYFATYPGVRAYMDHVVEQAKTDGYVSTLMGRRRWLPELKSSNFNTRSFGERVALNMPIQGTAADIIKLAMLRVRDRLKAEGLRGQLVLQVHDELIVECPQEEQERVCALLQEEMEGVFPLSVPLVAETHAGKSWAESH